MNTYLQKISNIVIALLIFGSSYGMEIELPETKITPLKIQTAHQVAREIYADLIINSKKSKKLEQVQKILSEDLLQLLAEVPIDEDHNTLLLLAAKMGLPEQVKTLFTWRADVSRENDLRETALDIACRYNHFDITKIGMQHIDEKEIPFDFNRRSVIFENTPLHWTAQHGDIEVLEELMERTAPEDESDRQFWGKNPNTENNKGYTPLHVAAANGQVKVMQSLFEARAYYLSSSTTPLHLAAYNSHIQALNFLINRANVRCRENLGALLNELLHSAAQEGNVTILNALIDSGANVKSYLDYKKCTPLHLAAGNGQVDALKALIAAGADKEAQTDLGKTPLDYAKQKGHTAIVEILEQEPMKG